MESKGRRKRRGNAGAFDHLMKMKGIGDKFNPMGRKQGNRRNRLKLRKRG